MNQDKDALFKQAYQLQREGNLSDAITIFKEILNLDPNHPPTLHFLGLTYAQTGDMTNALDYLTQAVLIEPEPSLLNNLANVYKKTGNLDKAIQYYQKAIESNPDYAQAHNNLATVYATQNKYQQALAHYIKAVHAEPDFSAAHFNLGLLLLQNKELTAAHTQFNNVLSLNPEHIDAHFYSGILYLEENMLDEAEHAFQQVINQDNEHIQALINLGVIALKLNKNQTAVDYFTKALALDNENIDARNNLAATFIHHDRFENALMHYDVLLSKDPENIEYLYNAGVAEMALGHLNEAIVYFERTLNVDNHHTPSLNNLAAIYLKMDLRETSREYLERALRINPADSISRHMLQALSGDDNAQTTPEYAHNLFNNYALTYEKHMQDHLKYTIPHHIGRSIHELKLTHLNQTLDLGCGTGLTGIVLREVSEELTGVDIAEKMIAYAQEKQIYDHLYCEELLRFLVNDSHQYDLIVAADVLPYFAALDTLFSAISNHLTPKGYFIFTTEISAQIPWKLESTARFSHHPEYIQSIAQNCGLKIVSVTTIPARLQNEVPLDVNLYIYSKYCE
ncbi:MAG: tetratricopeptide repeat protein [Legionella sp.]|nr:tetratricopeptide repeat protein [Legionella sp.]